MLNIEGLRAVGYFVTEVAGQWSFSPNPKGGKRYADLDACLAAANAMLGLERVRARVVLGLPAAAVGEG